MVANLSSHKRGWDERWEEFSQWAEKGQALKDELIYLVDEDTHSFNRLMAANRLPRKTDEDRRARAAAVAEATRYAINVPFQVMERSLAAMELLAAMAETGLASSVSDAGVGVLCARAALRGAFLNVKINVIGLDDAEFVAEKLTAGQAMADEAERLEREILAIVDEKIESG